MSGATTFAAFVKSQNPAITVLLEVGAGEVITGWTLTSGIVYEAAIAQQPKVHSFRTITSCKAETTALVLKTSIATVQATAGSFWHDTTAGKLYVSMADSSSPTGKTVVGDFTLYYAGGHPRMTGFAVVFNGNLYYPYLDEQSIQSVRTQAQDPHFGTAVASLGAVSLMNGTGNFDALVERYLWHDRTVKVLLGGDDLPYSEYKVVYTGLVQEIEWSEDRVSLRLTDQNEFLLTSVPQKALASADLTTSYTFLHKFDYTTSKLVSTTWPPPPSVPPGQPYPNKATDIDANAVAKATIGIVKPVLYGTCKFVKGIVLAQSSYFAMVLLAGHDIRDMTGVYIDGVKQTVPSPAFYVDKTSGIMLVSQHIVGGIANMTFGADVDGKPNSDGTSRTNIAAMIDDLVTVQSGITTPIDATSLATAKTDLAGYVANYRIESVTTLREALEPLLRSGLVYMFVGRDGAYRLIVWSTTQAGEVELADSSGDVFDLGSSLDATRIYKDIIVGYDQDPSRTAVRLYSTTTRTDTQAKWSRRVSYSVDSVMSDKTSADLLGSNLALLGSAGIRLTSVATRLKLLDYDLMQSVVISRPRVPKDATKKVHGRIVSSEIDMTRLVNTLVIHETS